MAVPVPAMVPSELFPLATPLTSHVICVSAAGQSDAAKVRDWLSEMLAAGGVSVVEGAHSIFTAALPDFAGSATLVAVTVTDGDAGAALGAV